MIVFLHWIYFIQNVKQSGLPQHDGVCIYVYGIRAVYGTAIATQDSSNFIVLKY